MIGAPENARQDAYDVCIIGSGAGGGMAAYALTRAGARVVIINAEPTGMDDLADLVLRGSIGDLLPRIIAPATS